MKQKRILAGMLAIMFSAVNIVLPVSAEEVPFSSENINVGSSIVKYSYDPETRRFLDANGNIFVPERKDSGLNEDSAVVYPAQYDTRELFAKYGVTFPEIKDQGPTETCWVHSVLASVEVGGIMDEVLSDDNCNFSEAHLAYFGLVSDPDTSSPLYGDHYYVDPSPYDYYEIYNNGGNLNLATFAMSQGTGPVFELPEWDIAPDHDYVAVLVYDEKNQCSYVYDRVPVDKLYSDYTEYLNDPYNLTTDLTTDIWYDAFSEELRYYGDYKLTEREDYYYDYDVNDLSSIDNIKQGVMDRGCLTLSYYAVNDYYNNETAYYFPEEAFAASGIDSLTTNHSISIVGWDDNYSRENFGVEGGITAIDSSSETETYFSQEDLRPQKDGAWICRNSWGEDVHDNGYFYLSYEEPEICEVASFSICEDNPEEKIYQYDGVLKRILSFNGATGHTEANIFTAEGDELLTGFSFWTLNPGVTCNVRVYTGVTEGMPMSGTCVYDGSTGIIENSGFHAFDFDETIMLSEGDTFSVVLYKNENAFYGDSKCSGTNDSFVFPDEATSASYFTDTYESGFNVPIKAFTVPYQETVAGPENVRAIAGDGKALLLWDEVEGADSYQVYCLFNGTYQKVGSPVTTTYRLNKDLTNNNEYIFAVTAISDGIESDRSADVGIMPVVGKTIVDAPVITNCEASGSASIDVSWSKVAGAENYKVYCGTSSSVYNAECVATTANNSYTITSLEPGTTYYIWVVACGYGDESGYSDKSQATTNSASTDKLSAPTGLTGVAGDGKVTLSWSSVTAAYQYRIYYSTTNSPSTAKYYTSVFNYEGCNAVVTGLTNGTKYYFWVTADTSVGGKESDKSTVFTATPQKASEAATVVYAAYGAKAEVTAVTDAAIYSYTWEYKTPTGWATFDMNLDYIMCGYIDTNRKGSTLTVTDSSALIESLGTDSVRLAYKTSAQGATYYSDTFKISILPDDQVTVEMVKAMTFEQCTRYVNHFTETQSDVFVLTDAMMAAIEKVL